MPLSPAGRRWLGAGLAVVGFALLARTLLSHGIQGEGGGGGVDAIAYWTATQHVVHGQPLYALAPGSFTAYTYPPVVAQLLSPLSILPMPVFVWLWRLLELIGLRTAIGSWRRAGWAMLVFPPVLAELDAANVHLIIAGACGLAMRGRGLAIAPSAMLKWAAIPLAPLGWKLDRRGLVIGVVVTALVAVASALVSWSSWVDYVDYLRTTPFPHGWYNVAEFVPLPLRLATAGVLGLAAVRWARLAPIAVLLAYPVVWFHSLSTLAAILSPIPRLEAARGLKSRPVVDEPAIPVIAPA